MKTELSDFTHLPQIVSCHKKAFPEVLSTMQGDRFISKMMEWYLVSDRGVLFHISEGNRIVGYCGGIITREPGLHGVVSSISQYAFGEFVKSYLRKPWLFFHPENLKRSPTIFRNILYKLKILKKKKATVDQAEAFHPFMGLVVIGVDPEFHGKGYGSTLIREFERMARQEGLHHVQLSVNTNNVKAIASYERNGWAPAKVQSKSMSMKKKL